MYKWHKIKVIYSWFYYIRNFVNNYFNGIGAIITNSGENNNINIINTIRKTSKSISSILFCPPLVFQEGENYSIPDNKNEKNIK